MMDTQRNDRGILSRRNFLGALGAGAALGAGSLSLASCTSNAGSDSSPSSGGAPSGDLTVAVFGTDQTAINSFKDLFKLYKKQYPDVNLKVRGIAASDWGSYFNTVSTQIAGGSAPDIVQVATEGLRLFSSKGLVTPLDPYIKRDKDDVDEFLNDVNSHFQDQVNKYVNPDGKTYYLPGSFNTMCMWCNLDVFRKAGAEEPQDEWTWDDFLKACQKISQMSGDVFPYAARNGGAGYFTGIEPWLLSNSANTMNDAWDKATMDSPEAIEAVAFNRDLVKKGYMPPPGGKFDEVAAVSQGKAAMVGGGRWPISQMRSQNVVDSIKIVSWPKKTELGTPVGWNCYPILEASKNKEAAWAFVKFVHTKEAEKFFAKGGGTIVPARKSVALSSSFLDNSPANTEELYNSLSYATVIPAPNKNNVVEREIIDWLERILVGNVGVKEGCKGLNEKIQSTL